MQLYNHQCGAVKPFCGSLKQFSFCTFDINLHKEQTPKFSGLTNSFDGVPTQ